MDTQKNCWAGAIINPPNTYSTHSSSPARTRRGQCDTSLEKVGYSVCNAVTDDMVGLIVHMFCELISSTVCNWAGPIVDLLLDYVGDVQLLSARPLMHLCRLRIHEQMVVSRLRSLDSLPLPEIAAIYCLFKK
uniref:SOCS box domain-containing protein n=1 Tax=Oncorhynchus tshawytscha TaxID=74940 RepID=A0A8C8CHL5_ONCTS